MKSVDKLRELADKLDEAAARMSEHGFSPIGLKTKIVCDEIEREIEERYLPAPLDADGVPIHVGDNLHSDETGRDFPCRGYNLTLQGSKKWWTVECCYNSYSVTSEYVSAKSCHHVKPRTLEDVLTEMLDRNTDGVGLREFNRDFGAFVAHYADEIRELLEVGE